MPVACEFQKLKSDLFRAALGFDAGDLEATTADGAKVEMFNVIFVSRKVLTVEQLIAVRPDHTA